MNENVLYVIIKWKIVFKKKEWNIKSEKIVIIVYFLIDKLYRIKMCGYD